MSAVVAERIVQRSAWEAYRQAFHDYADRVGELQWLLEHPNPERARIENALLEVEKARVIYNNSRDAVAQDLLPPGRRPKPVPNPVNGYREHVRDIAELLWESAGRPNGTAEQDWHKAEEIVKRAVTAA